MNKSKWEAKKFCLRIRVSCKVPCKVRFKTVDKNGTKKHWANETSKCLGTCTKALFLIWLYNVLICGARYMSNMKLSCEVRKNINKDSSYYSTKRGVQPSWSCRDSPGICLEIPSPDQHTIGIIKITILTSVLIFSKTSTRCILRASKRSASPCGPWSRYDFESRERPGRVGDRSCRLHHNTITFIKTPAAQCTAGCKNTAKREQLERITKILHD